MRHASFHDHVGPQPPDHFLDADHVLRQLDYRPTHPGEAIDILHVPAAAEPGGGYRLECLGRVERMLFRRSVRVANGYAAICLVDGEHGFPVQGPAASANRQPDRWRWRRIRSSSRVVSIGGCRTVGASGAKPMCQPAMLCRQQAMAAWLGVAAGRDIVEPVPARWHAIAGSNRATAATLT